MRTYDEIIHDPLASDEEIEALAKKLPVKAVQHANCPAKLWWRLAWGEDSLEALESPAYVLFVLEDPAQWRKIEMYNLQEWITRRQYKLTPPAMLRFAADCTEHVLPLWDETNPVPVYADVVRQSILWRRAEAKIEREHGKGYGHNFPIFAPAAEAEARLQFFWSRNQLGKAAASVAGSASSVGLAALNAAQAVEAYYDDGHTDARAEMRYKEELWQWHRLQEYLRGHR